MKDDNIMSDCSPIISVVRHFHLTSWPSILFRTTRVLHKILISAASRQPSYPSSSSFLQPRPSIIPVRDSVELIGPGLPLTYVNRSSDPDPPSPPPPPPPLVGALTGRARARQHATRRVIPRRVHHVTPPALQPHTALIARRPL